MKFRDQIVAFLETNPLATPSEIATGLGGAADPVLIRQTVGRMARASILRRVGHGRYVLHQRYELRAQSVERVTEELIHTLLTEAGGIATTSELHKAVWGGERLPDDRPYDYVRVVRALRRSPLFKQSFGRGIWNLREEEMKALVLRGRWACLVLDMDILERDAFFEAVGAGFCDARGDFEIASVASDPAISGALGHMAVRAHRSRERAEALQTQDRETGEAHMALGGYLLWLFEQGAADLHLSAPAAFYRECARLYGVNGANLSRTVAAHDFHES